MISFIVIIGVFILLGISYLQYKKQIIELQNKAFKNYAILYDYSNLSNPL